MDLLVVDRPTDIETVNRIANLLFSVWPPKEEPIDVQTHVKEVCNFPQTRFRKDFLLVEGKELIGYAFVFDRTIQVGGKTIDNMALGNVCVKPNNRNKGFGSQLVLSAFEYVNKGMFSCCLLQTPVREFYLKLGAKEIKNRVYNSMENNINPFWDPYIMLYPAKYEITSNDIDLLGKGY